MKSVIFNVVVAALAVLANAQTGTKPNSVQGQGQMEGTYATFGTVYSLKNQFNFAILKAAYTVESFGAMTGRFVQTNEKLLMVDIAIKNVSKSDNFFDNAHLISAVDSKGNLYEAGWYGLASNPIDTGAPSLKPGQGLGQAELKDPFRVGILVPGDAKITKIIINKGRAGTKEEVVRYLIAKTAKEADPKNIVAPLPANVADSSDASGATALAVGKGAKGASLPSGWFSLKVESAKLADAPIGDMELGEDRALLVVTMSAKLTVNTGATMFEVLGGDDSLNQLTDADGERYHPIRALKASSDADADHEFKVGGEYRFRLVFDVPKQGQLKSLVIGAGQGRIWAFDPAALLGA